MAGNFLKSVVSSKWCNGLGMEGRNMLLLEGFLLIEHAVFLYLQLFGTKRQMKTSRDGVCVFLDINTF